MTRERTTTMTTIGSEDSMEFLPTCDHGNERDSRVLCLQCLQLVCTDCIRIHHLTTHSVQAGSSTRSLTQNVKINVQPGVGDKAVSMDSTGANHGKLTSDREKYICCNTCPTASRISGMMLMNNNLVVTDYTNNSVKLISTGSQAILSEVTFSNSPWDLTKITDDKVAVTITKERKIVFLQVTKSNLTEEREITVHGYCDGIVAHKGQLVVTYLNPGKVEVVDLNGQYCRRIDTSSKGDMLFREPRHVAMAQDRDWLYVSDFQMNNVTCVDMYGKVMGTYTDKHLKGPEGLAVDNRGRVFVCGASSNNIHLISAKCEKLCIFLKSQSGLQYPQSVLPCDDTIRLYVGMDGGAHIRVYNISKDGNEQIDETTDKTSSIQSTKL